MTSLLPACPAELEPTLESPEMTLETALQTVGDYARHAAEFLSDRLASDIVLIAVEDICSYADYLIIATGETDRHLDAMANDLTRELRKRGLHAGHREGEGSGGWVLIDFPGFVVDLFAKDIRDYYALDKLWARGTEVVRLQ
jgi:ribosome-associated protein